MSSGCGFQPSANYSYIGARWNEIMMEICSLWCQEFIIFVCVSESQTDMYELLGFGGMPGVMQRVTRFGARPIQSMILI